MASDSRGSKVSWARQQDRADITGGEERVGLEMERLHLGPKELLTPSKANF